MFICLFLMMLRILSCCTVSISLKHEKLLGSSFGKAFDALSSVQFSCSVVSNSLRPHGLQHTKPSCPSATPSAYTNSCPLSQWCHPTISSSVFPFPLPSTFLSIRVFSNESVLCTSWQKYYSLSFNISPSNEYSGLISFRMDCLYLLAVQGTLRSLLQHDSSKA